MIQCIRTEKKIDKGGKLSSKQDSRALRLYSDVLGLALSKLVNVILWLACKDIKKLNDNRILIDSTAFQNATTKPPKPEAIRAGNAILRLTGLAAPSALGRRALT
jgi:hypothetical protein